MRGSVGSAQGSRRDCAIQFPGIEVISGQWRDPALVVAINAAIADCDPVQLLAVNDHCRQGRAGVVEFSFVLGQFANGVIGSAQELMQGGGDGFIGRFARIAIEKGAHRDLAGGAAQGMAAHAVGQHCQGSALGTLHRVEQIGEAEAVLLFGAVAAMLGVTRQQDRFRAGALSKGNHRKLIRSSVRPSMSRSPSSMG